MIIHDIWKKMALDSNEIADIQILKVKTALKLENKI